MLERNNFKYVELNNLEENRKLMNENKFLKEQITNLCRDYNTSNVKHNMIIDNLRMENERLKRQVNLLLLTR